jgi:tetratricopeptide (TPR) repeat protein
MPGDAKKLGALLGRTWREAFYLVETNYTGGDDSGSAVTHLALRLFRNRPEYRFEGRIHEQKTQRMPTFLPERFETTPIRMLHYGYLKSRISAKDKAKRNLELLEAELAEVRTAFTLFNLGSEHLSLEDATTARGYLDEAWTRVKQEELWAELGYVPLLATRVAKARRQAGDISGAREAIAEARAVYSDHTDLAFEAALCGRDAGDPAEARRHAELCLEMGDSPARYIATAGSGTYLALNLLADMALRERRLADAEALLRRSLAEHPGYLASILPLATVLFARGADPAEVEREISPDRPSALVLSATACYEAGHFDVAERWFRAVLDRQPGNATARVGLVESLLSQRRYGEAAAEAACEPDSSPIKALLSVSELFALAAAGEGAGLDEALTRAEQSGVSAPELELYRLWRGALAGEAAPMFVPAAVAPAAATVLEALLRVQEVDAFALVHAIFERTAIDPRDRREQLARMYLRRGFLESAADEWIAVVSETPDVEALVGLAQVAVARDLPEDALLFAEEAVALDPAAEGPRRLRDAVAALVA